MKKVKQKMQEVSFRSVDEFLEFLPEEELKITEELRKTVFECIPEVKEKLSYNVPFYRKYATICFIWPSSVLWGKKKTYEGVRLGFAKGHLMKDTSGYLDKGDRKQVYWRDFPTIKDIEYDLVRSFLFEAALLDNKIKK